MTDEERCCQLTSAVHNLPHSCRREDLALSQIIRYNATYRNHNGHDQVWKSCEHAHLWNINKCYVIAILFVLMCLRCAAKKLTRELIESTLISKRRKKHHQRCSYELGVAIRRIQQSKFSLRDC